MKEGLGAGDNVYIHMGAEERKVLKESKYWPLFKMVCFRLVSEQNNSSLLSTSSFLLKISKNVTPS